MRPLNERDTIQALNGMPTWLGTITGSVATDNRTTSTTPAFFIPSGACLLLQPDTACSVAGVAVADHAVARSITLQANEKFMVFMPNTESDQTNRISMTPVSGSTALKVFRVTFP